MAFENYKQQRTNHWNTISKKRKKWRGLGNYYHKRIIEIYQDIIPIGSNVLEIGCAEGNLLAAVKPKFGVGIDFSEEMINTAKEKYPDLNFYNLDAHNCSDLHSKFDFIILSDLINDLWDIQKVLQEVYLLCKPNTRIILNNYSRVWQIPLTIAQSTNLATPTLQQNWITPSDIISLLYLTNFEKLKNRIEILFPFYFPLLTTIFNKFLVRFPVFSLFALTNIIIARPLGLTDNAPNENPLVSVVVPARNEAGNIKNIIDRIPEMGSGTEIIFVEGGSKDETYETIKHYLESNYRNRNMVLYKQHGKGKADAVQLGFKKASGDILMILDADLTVPPEDLPRFYDALVDNKGEFINGVRLIYPMEKEAMRFLNFLGNKFFSMAFTWLLGQPIKDTLCGTKVLWKADYEKIAKNRSFFGDFDPFGDFDLIFGAAKLNLKLLDIPIRYRDRTYGSTNISRFSHGLLLLKMVWVAAKRLKFR
ncbi:MAG: glycosyl transferase [Anaerolineaceae bacterium]|nr:glycosyl transferase [Anaerolineaceae bacterium]